VEYVTWGKFLSFLLLFFKHISIFIARKIPSFDIKSVSLFSNRIGSKSKSSWGLRLDRARPGSLAGTVKKTKYKRSNIALISRLEEMARMIGHQEM